MKRIGFVVNPIAGMGGRVGLKGTDGVVAAAVARGALPSAPAKAVETLRWLKALLAEAAARVEPRWLTCAGAMGADALRCAAFADAAVVHAPGGADTSGADTKAAAARFVDHGVDLILFCGGDGTARDLCGVVGDRTPILGIPAGVKMYSAVFGANPRRTAEILFAWLEGTVACGPSEVLDLDEDRYRRGEWVVRQYCTAMAPREPTFTPAAKMLLAEGADADAKEEIARFLFEDVAADPDCLVLLGPGSTVRTLGELLRIEQTLLGIDAVAGGKLVGKDLDEKSILALLDHYPRRKLILSPLGAQGFVLGRGNQPLSAEVVRRIGPENVIVVATPEKLRHTPLLRFDTGDAALDAALCGAGYVPVVIGHRLRRLVRAVV
ncbi:MAG: ATP-NAD kinase family protein [Alphaproteobacteria bacterium]|nr:ATP-NAD kinase family protein [Alphaproteobacteria bacterium]